MKKSNIMSNLGIAAAILAALFEIASAVFSEAGADEEMREEVRKCVREELYGNTDAKALPESTDDSRC